MKGKLKQTKGITLIALIITIIILLILAVVSIRLVVNNGILGKAEHATQKYTEEEAAEQEKLLKAEYEMAKYEGKFSGSYDSYTVWKQYGVKIGDYIEYDATKDANGNTITGDQSTYTSKRTKNGYSDQVFNLSSYSKGWRVLGVENGQLQLVSAGGVTPDEWVSYSRFCLCGTAGYIHGKEELDTIAGMYGQGKGATGARSINVDDVNKITGYNPTKTGDGKPYGSGNIKEYNNKVTYYWDGSAKPYYEYEEGESKKSGNLVADHNPFVWYNGSGWQSSAKSTTATTSTKERITELTSTYYTYFPTTLTDSSSGEIKGIAETSDEWEILFANTLAPNYESYWLASSFVFCASGSAGFGISHVGRGIINDDYSLWLSSNRRNEFNYEVRPVVSLKSDIQIEKTDAKDGSTLEKACIIK